MISIPSIRSGLPFENSASLFLNTRGDSQSGKSINLRFVMGSLGGITLTLFGVTKSVSGADNEMIFTSSEIPSLNISENLYVQGYMTSVPDFQSFIIPFEDLSKIAGLTTVVTDSGDIEFTIVYDQVLNNDTIDFRVIQDN